jgi:hypothetical protein
MNIRIYNPDLAKEVEEGRESMSQQKGEDRKHMQTMDNTAY